MSDQGWQPIDDSVKCSGARVLLFWRSNGVEFYGFGSYARFFDGSGGWSGASFASEPPGNWTSFIGEMPTHFMPLPAPPEVQ